MKNFHFKLACFLTGFNYEVLKKYDNWSKRKVSIFAIALMFPTVIWFLNGFFLTGKILGGSTGSAIFVGLVCAMIIFFIERIIIMSAGSTGIFIFRLVLASAIAFLGSFLIKEVIFEKDINRALEVERINATQAYTDSLQLKAGIAIDSSNLKKLINKRDFWLEQMRKEQIDSSGSGQVGNGPIAKSDSATAANIMREEVVPEERRIDSSRKSNAEGIKVAIDQYEKDQKNNEGLITRLDAYFKVTFSSGAGWTIFILFFLILAGLEIFVVFLKKYLAKSNMEKDEKIINDKG